MYAQHCHGTQPHAKSTTSRDRHITPGGRSAAGRRVGSRAHGGGRNGLSFIEIAALILMAALLVAAAVAGGARQDHEIGSTTRVRVERNDTLWNLAATCATDGRSTAQTVDVIRELNDLSDSTLQAGQLLTLPVQEAPVVASR